MANIWKLKSKNKKVIHQSNTPDNINKWLMSYFIYKIFNQYKNSSTKCIYDYDCLKFKIRTFAFCELLMFMISTFLFMLHITRHK